VIHIRALGPVAVTVDGAPAPKALTWRKHIALMVYLARSPRRARTRDHLVGLLWAEKPEDDARQSLNEALRHVRKYAGDGELDTEGGQVRVGVGGVKLDADELDQCLAAKDWGGAAALVGGQFLDGFSVPDASDFETWLATEQRHWCGRSIEALTRRANQLSDEGYSLEATDLAHRALNLDRESSAALYCAMRCLLLGGERAAALDLYADFERRLRALGLEPDADIKALAERIRRAHVPQPPKPPTPAAAPRRAPLVAVAQQMTTLLGVWTACRAGRAGMGMVEGDPGTGKTRLLDEVAARVRADGGAVLLARAVPADRDLPGAALVALVRGGLLDTPGIAAAAPAALAAFAQDDPAWAERFPQTRNVAPLPLAAAFTAVLREAAAERPLAVVLDDAQYADDESLQSLAAVVRDLARLPVLILIATHPAPAREAVDALRARLGRDVPGASVRLGSFDHANLVALVRWALPTAGDDLVDRMARRLAADTGGLPLLAIELIRAIASGAELPPADSTWLKSGHTLDQTLPGDLPDAVTASIRGNYHRMSQGGQEVLQVVAILGDRVAMAVIARVTKFAGDVLAAALDECEWQRWLVAEPRGYSYVARIVRQIIDKDMVTKGKRQRILDAAAGA
jgi:DNA-binding SARP family transcriptional activator